MYATLLTRRTRLERYDSILQKETSGIRLTSDYTITCVFNIKSWRGISYLLLLCHTHSNFDTNQSNFVKIFLNVHSI